MNSKKNAKQERIIELENRISSEKNCLNCYENFIIQIKTRLKNFQNELDKLKLKKK